MFEQKQLSFKHVAVWYNHRWVVVDTETGNDMATFARLAECEFFVDSLFPGYADERALRRRGEII